MVRFTDSMWTEIAPIYEAILALPFNRELAAGTLGRERFLFYMIQDAHYLGAFARALATAAAKAETAEAQVKLAGSAKDAILVERALHEGFFREFGVSPEQFAATPSSPTCSGYSDFLQATAFRYPFAVAVAALLPCFQIYMRSASGCTRSRRRPTPTSAGSTPTRTRRSATRCAKCSQSPMPRTTRPPPPSVRRCAPPISRPRDTNGCSGTVPTGWRRGPSDRFRLRASLRRGWGNPSW